MSVAGYQVTREECESRISGVCPGCGGPLVAIETVDNARNPTHWSGCLHCCVFTDGCPPETQRLARTLVEEGTLVPYSRDSAEALWIESNTRRVTQILRRIKALQDLAGEAS
jgi:hypothetical protein